MRRPRARTIAPFLALFASGCIALEPGDDRLDGGSDPGADRRSFDDAATGDASATGDSGADDATAARDAGGMDAVDPTQDATPAMDALPGMDAPPPGMDAAPMDAQAPGMDAALGMDAPPGMDARADASAPDAFAPDAFAPDGMGPIDTGVRDSGPDAGSDGGVMTPDGGVIPGPDAGDAGTMGCYPPNMTICGNPMFHCDTTSCTQTACRANGALAEGAACTPGGAAACAFGLVCVPNLNQCRVPCDPANPTSCGARFCIEATSCMNPVFTLGWGYCQ